MTKKLDSFYVSAKLRIDCAICIKAESLEDALVRSRELKDSDFVSVLGDYNDGDMKITGLFHDD